MNNRTPSRARRGPAIAARLGAVALGALAWVAAWPARSANPDALWRVVHDLCVPDMKALGLPAPCAAVNLTRGYVVLKDLAGATQYLVIPTRRITGIESRVLQSPSSPNYWQWAWEARGFFEKSAGRKVPRDEIGLAVNSVRGRSQNQLHIHIDFVRADVRQALRANQGRIGTRWSTLRFDLAGRRYRARRIAGENLGAHDPFKLLAQADPAARGDMGRWTLVVIGAVLADGKPGFIVLSDHVDAATNDTAAGEDLLDHGCAVLAAPAAS
ncbi:MAG: CDP-diacylglycerol diphosphatase [Caulobacterales bacterium]